MIDMHGPGHLLCCGVELTDEPLACAMWAGYYMAQGKSAEAQEWAKAAKDRLGKPIIHAYGEPGTNDFAQLRLIGELSPWMIEQISGHLAIIEKGVARMEQKRAEGRVAPAAPSGSPQPAAEAAKEGRVRDAR
jgi:hypothetical protein